MKCAIRSLSCILTLFVFSGSSSPLFSQENGVEIAGFADVLYVGGEDRFDLGQVEIDLVTPIAGEVDLEIAIALDEGTFTTGAVTADFHLWGREGSHFRQSQGIDHTGLIVGQFDVPFGIDWNVYPSIDRKLVSGPLVIENTHDGWNDVGLQGYLQAGRLNGAVYAVNGFGYEEVEMNLSLGGRIGFGLLEQLEIGGSYAAFLNGDYELDMGLIGADVQFSQGRLALKGEFVAHSLGLAGDGDSTNAGFYAQSLYDLDRYFLVARYGSFAPDEGENMSRVSLGAGWIIRDGCQMRFEQQINSEEDNLSLVQMVVAF